MNVNDTTETNEAVPKVVVPLLRRALREMDSVTQCEASSSVQSARGRAPDWDASKKRRYSTPRVASEFEMIKDKLLAIYPPFDLKPMGYDAKFLGRYRLYISNISSSVTKDDLEAVFKVYGEVRDVFVQADKSFGFVRMDYFYNAVKAKLCLHGTLLKGRKMFVTFSPHASILVKNLSPWVTNEFLHLSFSVFGDIESCTVLTDKRGKLTGEGVVDFLKKGSAMAARKYCAEKVFFVSSSFKPVVVEEYSCNTMPHDTEGFPEEMVRKCPEFYEDRNMGPRFAVPGTVEYDYGKRFLELWKTHLERTDMVKDQQKEEEMQLEAQLRRERYEEETNRLKEMIRQREMQSKGFYQPFNRRGNVHFKEEETSDQRERKYLNREGRRNAQGQWWMSDTPVKTE